jgi:hypothetical protein
MIDGISQSRYRPVPPVNNGMQIRIMTDEKLITRPGNLASGAATVKRNRHRFQLGMLNGGQS